MPHIPHVKFCYFSFYRDVICLTLSRTSYILFSIYFGFLFTQTNTISNWEKNLFAQWSSSFVCWPFFGITNFCFARCFLLLLIHIHLYTFIIEWIYFFFYARWVNRIRVISNWFDSKIKLSLDTDECAIEAIIWFTDKQWQTMNETNRNWFNSFTCQLF